MSKNKKKRSNPNDTSGPSKRRHLSEIEGPTNRSFDSDESLRCGKIVRIHLTNFMCHSNLKIELSRRVNMLIGANGSGKSAILTALIVGLGAKARDTNRSSSIKQLVKSGTSSADIDITILNVGSEAYEPEIYGNNITISRHILASGSTTYKIKDCGGNVISTKVDELHKILLFHNIQTDNPVFVLNQDSARSFLKEMEPSKNYILFLKATQIETILEKLNQCGTMYRDYKYRLSCYKKQIELMEKELEELREKRERLESADEIKKKAEYHKLEILWLNVQKQEESVNELTDLMEKEKQKHNKLKKLIEEKDNAEKSIKNEIKESEKQFQEKNSSFRSKLENLNKLQASFKEAAEKYEQKLYECNKFKKKVNEYRKQIECYEQQIEERTGSGLTQVQKLRAENEQKLRNFQQGKEEVNILIDQQKRELNLLKETKERQEEEFENVNRQRIKFSDKIVMSEKEILKIKSFSTNKLAVYGQQMSDFVDDIKRNQKKFSELPIGPLGQYIFVSDQKWRGVVELLLGNLLQCFIVNNEKDLKILTQIKNKYQSIRNSIITTKFRHQVYDVSSGKCYAPRGSTLLMDEIKCDNPVIMNCLIDRSRIETILLTEEQDIAIKLTQDQNNVPKHLSRVILLKPFLEYYPAPMYRAYSLNERTPRFIQVNMQEMRKHLENEMEQYKGARTAAEEKLRVWKNKLGEIYRQIKKNEDILAKHHSKMNSLHEKMEEIKSFEYPEENRIEFFKNEISALQNSIKDIEEQIVNAENEIQMLMQEKIDKRKAHDEQKNKFTNEEEEVNQIKKSIDDLKTQLYSIHNNTTNGQKKLESISKLIEDNNDKLIVETQTLTTLINTAEENGGERVEVTKSEEELTRLVKKYEYSIKQILRTDDKLDDIKILLEDKELRHEKFQLFTVSIERTLELLKKSRVQRFKFIVNLKNHMALRVKFTFNSILKIKNFSGNIEFDHAEQKLKLTVVPRDNHINNAVSNTKSLSGGERSFSTVALLLSLWQCVDHPFYFLDEYDVFTDQVNREIMTKLLLSEADRKPQRQFTFLTPQDVSFVQASDTVVIHKLAEPER